MPEPTIYEIVPSKTKATGEYCLVVREDFKLEVLWGQEYRINDSASFSFAYESCKRWIEKRGQLKRTK